MIGKLSGWMLFDDIENRHYNLLANIIYEQDAKASKLS